MPDLRHASTLYGGGGTSNALLTNKTTSAVAAATVITVGEYDTLHLMLTNPTASQSVKLIVTAYSASTPSISTQIFEREVVIGTTDLSATVDRAMVGLTTGTEHYTKPPVAVAVPRGSYVVVASNNSSGGTWYARYYLSRGGAESGEAAALDDVETKLDTINTSLGTLHTDLSTGPVPTLLTGAKARGTQVGTDYAPTWAVSALINTVKSTTFTNPTVVPRDYKLSLVNMSTVSAFTWKLFNREAALGASQDKDVLLASGSVDAATVTVIEDCEDAWTASAECTATAGAGGKVGNMVTVAVGEAFTTGLAAKETLAAAANMTGSTHLYAWVQSDLVTLATDLSFKLDDNSDFATPLAELAIPALAAGTWTRVMIPITDAQAAVLGAVTDIALYVNRDQGAQNILLDDISMVTIGTEEDLVTGLFNGCTTAKLTMQNETAMDAVNTGIAYARLREVG